MIIEDTVKKKARLRVLRKCSTSCFADLGNCSPFKKPVDEYVKYIVPLNKHSMISQKLWLLPTTDIKLRAALMRVSVWESISWVPGSNVMANNQLFEGLWSRFQKADIEDICMVHTLPADPVNAKPETHHSGQWSLYHQFKNKATD